MINKNKKDFTSKLNQDLRKYTEKLGADAQHEIWANAKFYRGIAYAQYIEVQIKKKKNN